jgi:hypothetical protein
MQGEGWRTTHQIEVSHVCTDHRRRRDPAALANAFRPGRSDIITSRPYNNRHNPASGARDLHY